jgi:hypothetical protein
LNLNLRHLKGAESKVGKDFSRRRAGKPDSRLVLRGSLLSGHVAVEILEDLVKTVLEHALKGVAEKGRPETFPDTSCTFLFEEKLDGGPKADILRGANLDSGRMMRNMYGLEERDKPTCMLHFATSRGVIPACVTPQAKAPPSIHLA